MYQAFMLLCFVVVSHSCTSGNTDEQKKKSFSIPDNLQVRENLVNYLDTTTRIFFVEYRQDSSVMVLTDSATKVEIHIKIATNE